MYIAAVCRQVQREQLNSYYQFLRVQEILEEEDVDPRLQYVEKWLVVAAPSPFYGEMVGCLTGQILSTVNGLPGLDANIKNHIYLSSERSNLTNSGDTFIARNWDGAIRNRSLEGHTKIIAVEVGVSQTYESLRTAISYSVCALRCSLDIAMCISDGNRKKDAAIEQAERDMKAQVRNNLYGPLILSGFTMVILETFRKSDEICQLNTLLDPTQSLYVIVEDGRYIGEAELTLGDCIPTHILTGNNIKATHLNFLEEEWFQESFQIAIVETAVERFSDKNRVQPA
ncbi:hypothetical protein V1524DRAFT_470740 [Lipomyces starkeyi]